MRRHSCGRGPRRSADATSQLPARGRGVRAAPGRVPPCGGFLLRASAPRGVAAMFVSVTPDDHLLSFPRSPAHSYFISYPVASFTPNLRLRAANTQLSGSSRAGLFGSPPCSLICLCGSVMPSVTWVRAQLEYPHPFPLYVIRQSNLALRPANRFKRKKNLPTSSLALFSHFYQFFSGTVLGLK